VSVLKSLTGRTRVVATVSPIGEVAVEVVRNGQTLERLAYGREQDLNRTHRLAREGNVVNVYETGPDGERLVKSIDAS